MAKNKNSRRKNNLYKQNPHCFWCGVKTIIIEPTHGGVLPKNAATLEHLDSRNYSHSELKMEDGRRTVLACWECNSKRNEIEVKRFGPKRPRTFKRLFNYYFYKIKRCVDKFLDFLKTIIYT